MYVHCARLSAELFTRPRRHVHKPPFPSLSWCPICDLDALCSAVLCEAVLAFSSVKWQVKLSVVSPNIAAGSMTSAHIVISNPATVSHFDISTCVRTTLFFTRALSSHPQTSPPPLLCQMATIISANLNSTSISHGSNPVCVCLFVCLELPLSYKLLCTV